MFAIIHSLVKKNRRTAIGAATGSVVGALLGPVGAAVGAGIGATIGYHRDNPEAR